MPSQLLPCAPKHQCFKAIPSRNAGLGLRMIRAHGSSTDSSIVQPGRILDDVQLPKHPQSERLNYSRRNLFSTCAATALLLSISHSLQPQHSDAAVQCELQTSAATGLKWCDITVGDGPPPIKGAFTKAHYTAKLASTGVVFDSSYQRKTPLIFKVGEHELIEAFDVAMLGAEDIPPMHEGGKRLVVAPPGPMQRQGTKSLLWVVGLSQALEEAGELSLEGSPTSDLVFEIELLAKRRR